jgi:ribosomal protein L29
MDAKELRQKNPVELKALIAELTVKLRDLRFGAKLRQGAKVAEMRTVRRDLARANMVLSEAATK